MAQDQAETQHTQSTDGAGADSGSEKLVFGKFKTLDEAEKSYKELERKFHDGNEKFTRFESRLDRLEQLPVDEGYGRGQVYVPPQQTSGDDNTQLLTRFYSDTKGVLAEVEERGARRAYQLVTSEQRKAQDYQARVAQWTQDNPDVAAYGDLLTHYVGQTDGRLAPETRLDRAAVQVRKRVLELKGKPTQQNDDPAQFVDGAIGSRGGEGESRAAVTQPASSESQLKSYTAARNIASRKPLQHGGPRK
jgi:hypothetical protein